MNTEKYVYADFPHKELLRLDTRQEANDFEGDKDHLWAVTEDDDLYDENFRYGVYIYGHRSHYVNHLFHILADTPFTDTNYIEYAEFELSTESKFELLNDFTEGDFTLDNSIEYPDAIEKAWAELVAKARKDNADWVKNDE